MYSGAESIEHVNAYQQELARQLDRAAREIEVQRLLAPTNPDHGADLDRPRFGGVIAAIAGWFRPRRTTEQPSG